MDNLITDIKRVFALGIKEMPGYKLGDSISMAATTSKDIDSLPETERNDNVNG